MRTVSKVFNMTASPLSSYFPRDGLRESCEEFARRNGESPRDSRHAWRRDGLLALGLPPDAAAATGTLVAPGVPCPTSNGLAEIENE